MPGSFFDTNVVLYLASGDEDKATAAERILREGGAISVQVLNEAANVVRRKMGLSWPETREFLAGVRALVAVRPVTVATHEAGLELAERHSLSIYDAMIVAAALESGCETLWSEDMHHGLKIENRLHILNPFRTAA